MCASNVQDHMGQFEEVLFRHKVSGVIQRLLLLLRSAHCCHPAAQWYISHLWHSRQILHKVLYNFLFLFMIKLCLFGEKKCDAFRINLLV